MRDVLVIGNWKLNGNTNTITKLTTKLSNNCGKISKCKVAVAPPIIYLELVRRYLINSNIQLCAQNVDINLSGAFTGDISAIMLRDINTRYVIIGHSERRLHHQEDYTYIAKKILISKKTGLIPILCIGENKKEHDTGCTKSVCINQVKTIIQLLGIKAFTNTVIAYEPVWAIGTGLSALPKNVQTIHKLIRDYISNYDTSIANQIIIQYGGSVTPENITQFLDQEDIDGVLVGSSSLNVDSFSMIIQAAEQHAKVMFS